MCYRGSVSYWFNSLPKVTKYLYCSKRCAMFWNVYAKKMSDSFCSTKFLFQVSGTENFRTKTFDEKKYALILIKLRPLCISKHSKDFFFGKSFFYNSYIKNSQNLQKRIQIYSQLNRSHFFTIESYCYCQSYCRHFFEKKNLS